jgi:uncharacterized protein YukE
MNWEPLANGDPLAGDTDAIARLASLLRRYADDLNGTASKVSQLTTSNWTGPSADVFRGHQQSIPPKLTNTGVLLSAVGGMLDGFGSSLRAIHSSGVGIRNEATQVLNEINSVQPLAHAQQQHEAQQVRLAALGKPVQPWNGPNYVLHLANLRSTYHALQVQFNQLVSEYQSLSAKVTSSIREHTSSQSTVFEKLRHVSDEYGFIGAPALTKLPRVGNLLGRAQTVDTAFRFGQDIGKRHYQQSFEEGSDFLSTAVMKRGGAIGILGGVDITLWTNVEEDARQVNWTDIALHPGQLNPFAPGAWSAVVQSEEQGLGKLAKELTGNFLGAL